MDKFLPGGIKQELFSQHHIIGGGYRDNSICDIKPCSVKCYLKNCDKHSYIQKLYRDIRQIVTNRSLRLSRPNVIYISEFSRKILEPNISFSKK